LAERVAALQRPETRAALLADEASTGSPVAKVLMSRWNRIFPLGDPPDYEPHPDSSVAAVAARDRRRPEEVALDWLLEDDGMALLFAPLGSYVDQDHEVIREMISHPASIVGLSDGGAHCGLICDASFPTYLLTHWTRDRTRGELLPLELVVHKQTGATAAAYGLTDRGTLVPGMKADLNVIDVDALHLHAPEIITDLPAGGRRLVQRVDGYRWTVQSGRITFENGQATGARPGKVIRRESSNGG
jgi:N-acyl-D-aspartate/D-glutamate deacylase